jgi:hypothetical protein
VLLDKSEAVDNGFPGIAGLKYLAVDKDVAGIWVKQPVENADKRGLSGAVLAEQSVYFAFLQVKGDGVIGKNSRKSLRDAIDLQQFTTRLHSGRPRLKAGMSALSESRNSVDHFGQSAMFFGLISPEMIFA